MAYLPPSQKKTEDLATAPQISASSGGASTAPAGTPAPKADAPSSGGQFPGVQAFLQANRGGAMDKAVADKRAAMLPAANALSVGDEMYRNPAYGINGITSGAWDDHLGATSTARGELARADSGSAPTNRWDRAVTSSEAQRPKYGAVTNPAGPLTQEQVNAAGKAFEDQYGPLINPATLGGPGSFSISGPIAAGAFDPTANPFPQTTLAVNPAGPSPATKPIGGTGSPAKIAPAKRPLAQVAPAYNRKGMR